MPLIRRGIILLSLLFVGLALGYLIRYSTDTLFEQTLPEETANIASRIRVVVRDGSENRTLYLDTNQSYCKMLVLEGGNNPDSQDLAEPGAKIVYFFLEDIKDSAKADNYGDLIIRMNPIIKNGTRMMAVVFYAEGAYTKLVHYNDTLKHTYRDDLPESNYGIAEIEIG